MNVRTLKKRQSPILITSVTAELKAAGASIWMVSKGDDGITIRCTIAGKQARLIVPPPGGEIPLNENQQQNSLVHLVRDLSSLQSWLISLLN